MAISLQELGDQVQAAREEKGLSQAELAAAVSPPTNRSKVAHLEQGRRVPPPDVLERLCTMVGVPEKYWNPFMRPDYQLRLSFEESLSELVGHPVTLRFHDEHADRVAQEEIARFFESDLTLPQTLDALNRLLVYYDVPRLSLASFGRYFGPDINRSPQAFLDAVRRYQAEAIRLFGTFAEAYERLNSAADLEVVLQPLAERDDSAFRNRSVWEEIEPIPEDRLAHLGYVAAKRIDQETAEREQLATFLRELAEKVEELGKSALSSYGEKKRRRMDSLLRKLKSNLEHGLLSPLFTPDADALRREAAAVAPKANSDLAAMAETQATAQRNLARYLAADHLDVYVATSMRSDADFVSVNRFITDLVRDDQVRPLHLRYFNPTHSWIEDRVAKGLVEALMLRRSSLTIYMAQKTDTFGKDSEASVALGQGKPVIVYVPRLYVPEVEIDTEELGRMTRVELRKLLASESKVDDDDDDDDDAEDDEALLARLLTLRLHRLDPSLLPDVVRGHWADFDLYAEDSRIDEASERAGFRSWLDDVLKEDTNSNPDPTTRRHLLGILVATAVRFEARARLFREQHPLALQVILSSGVLNGILVARSVTSCARLIHSVIKNAMEVELSVDDHNYRLVERTTGSTVRVIPRHTLVGNAFTAFYSRGDVSR